MKWILIKMLEYRISRAERVKNRNGKIVERAYNEMIKNYKHTIMFLKAQKG